MAILIDNNNDSYRKAKVKIEGCFAFIMVIVMIAISLIIAIATVEGFVYMIKKAKGKDKVYVIKYVNDSSYVRDTTSKVFEEEWAKTLESYE